MKVPFDECLPLNFRHDLRGHEAHTVQWAGFKGKKNGELPRRMVKLPPNGLDTRCCSRWIRAYLIKHQAAAEQLL